MIQAHCVFGTKAFRGNEKKVKDTSIIGPLLRSPFNTIYIDRIAVTSARSDILYMYIYIFM